MSSLASELKESVVKIFLCNVKTLFFSVDPSALDMGVKLRISKIPIRLANKKGTDLDTLSLVALACRHLSLFSSLALLFSKELCINAFSSAFFIPIKTVLVCCKSKELFVIIIMCF